MTENDFLKNWKLKFSHCLDEIAGKEIRKKVLEGFEKLSIASSQKEIVDWIKGVMERLDALVDEKKKVEIMTGCACQYPQSDLEDIRKAYQKYKDIDLTHKMLQKKFISFLKNILKLDDELIQDIVNRGWGLAGVKKGNTIIATKIPKSGDLTEYFKEKDPEKKRAMYCHCPLIREAIGSNVSIPPTYCYCGAGFYKGIWEYILGQKVKVEVLESVLQGGDVCKIAIYLP
jgi:hypothetical protein